MGTFIKLHRRSTSNIFFSKKHSQWVDRRSRKRRPKRVPKLALKNQKKNPKKITGVMKPMKVSADLAAIIGKKEASRSECIKLLWAYMKKNNLQDAENRQYFTPDKKMAKIF